MTADAGAAPGTPPRGSAADGGWVSAARSPVRTPPRTGGSVGSRGRPPRTPSGARPEPPRLNTPPPPRTTPPATPPDKPDPLEDVINEGGAQLLRLSFDEGGLEGLD